MSNEISSLYQDIRSNLEVLRKAYFTTGILGDEESPNVRSSEEAQVILEILEFVAIEARALLDLHPSLESLFERNYGKLAEVFTRDAILDTIFIEEYIFPVTENYPVNVDGDFNKEVTLAYKDVFKAWCEEKANSHIETQDLLKNRFDLKLTDRDLACQCVQCSGDYRAQVREAVFATQTSLIDKAEERLHEMVLVKRIGDISNAVFNLKRDLDKNFHQMRNKLKRSSVNKLENEVKHHFRIKFGSKSDLGKVYKEKLNEIGRAHV